MFKNISIALLLLLMASCSSPYVKVTNNVLSVNTKNVKAIDQLKYSDVACGPTAFLNSLQFGGQEYRDSLNFLKRKDEKGKITYMIDKFCKVPSRHNSLERFVKGGISGINLIDAINEYMVMKRLPKKQGMFVNRGRNETQQQLLKRVHYMWKKSLKAGFPPIIMLDSYSVKYQNQKFTWHRLGGHFVTLAALPEKLDIDSKGFEFTYIDPYKAKLHKGYIYAEEIHPFAAWQFPPTGKKWLTHTPYLGATVPNLNLFRSREAWSSRTNIPVVYTIGSFK